MWRSSPASGDIRQHREHKIKQKEKDDTITVNTYQNKLNSQSYSRLKMPTMTGRPTLSRPSKSVRLLELEATSNANSRQASQRCWEEVGERGERTAAVQREDAQQNNSGNPGSGFCSGVLGVGEARVDSKGSGRASCLGGTPACAGCCVMSV
jgi:hypothetical protein